MSARNTLLFWVGAALLFALFIYAFSSILLPFVAGMALAYLLDPVADRLERLGLSRVWATAIMMILFVAFAVLALLLVVPLVGSQLSGLLARIPAYVDLLQKWLAQHSGSRLFRVLHLSPEEIRGSLGGVVSSGTSFVTTLISSLWSGGQALVSVGSLLVVTPVVAFYMLIDWNRMIAAVDDCLPRSHRDTIRRLARDMDRSVAKFVRGQVMVSVLLGLFYAVALSLVGLHFGLLIGFLAGVIGFIPYLGTITGGALSIGLAVVQFWPDYGWIAAVVAVFAAGQFIEGNVLQPKLIGSSVGLHPVWLMFALFAFGALLGFLGLLIAVPAAACVAVLVRFALARYRESPFYRGTGTALTAPDAAPPETGPDQSR